MSNNNKNENEKEVDFDTNDSPITLVQLDPLVVMKIVKQSRENLPELVTGQLLGLHFNNILDVTHSFASEIGNSEQTSTNFSTNFSDSSSSSSSALSRAEYQLEMMKCLNQVNVESNVVGWYQSSFLGSFFSETLVETQVNYQTKIKKSVVLIYDPFRTHNGLLSLKAYRLAEDFVRIYQENQVQQHHTVPIPQQNSNFSQNQTQTQLKAASLDELLTKNRLKWSDIFIEIPVSIRKSVTSDICLAELQQGSKTQRSINILDLNPNSFLEKNLECLIDAIDELSSDQNKKWYIQRKQHQQQINKQKEEGELEEGGKVEGLSLAHSSSLKSLLKTNQINNHCKQLNQFCGQTVSKLYLLNALTYYDSSSSS